MFKELRPQANPAFENRGKPSKSGLDLKLGCNPGDLRVEVAGYWSRLLLRVKRQSEVADQEQSAEEV
jgi:hypothetical protein